MCSNVGMEPAVSVVIPLYNKGEYIERTIQSVLQQTFKDFEVIVVNDGSTDGGPDIVHKFLDPRICLISQENAGVSAARNLGITTAKADLLAFLDADDEWRPHFLEAIQRLRKKFPEAGAYATAYELCDPDGTMISPRFEGIPGPPWEGIIPNYFRAGQGMPPVWSSAVAIPKAVFEDVGGFPVGVPYGEDLDTWLRIALKYSIAFSSKYQAISHRGSENSSDFRYSSESGLLLAESFRRAVEEDRVPLNLRDDISEYVAKYQIFAASRYVKAGNPAEARKILATCTNTRKLRYRWLWWFFWAKMPTGLAQFAWKTKRALASSQKRTKQLLTKK